MSTKKKLALYDEETGERMGEIPAGSTVETPEQKKLKREITENKVNQKFFVRSECGKFFWSLYYPEEDYFIDVSDAVLSRIIYLMTYLPYDRNYLVIREDVTMPYRPMRKDDVQKALGLTKQWFNDFWDNLMKTGVITEQENGKLVVCDRFRRGKLGARAKKDMSAMKIFDNCVRYLYENTTTKSHRYLAYLYRLIPYINASYNVFCSNPEETDRSKIKWLTAREMCTILGLDESNETRVVNTLFKLSFIDRNGDSRSVIKMLQDVKNGETRRFIAINPQFYQGYCITPTEATTLMQEFLLEDREVSEGETKRLPDRMYRDS